MTNFQIFFKRSSVRFNYIFKISIEHIAKVLNAIENCFPNKTNKKCAQNLV